MAALLARIYAIVWWCMTIASEASQELPADWCQSRSRFGYHRHPNNCASYVSCWNQASPLIQSCQDGLHFDQTLNTCNFASQVECFSYNKNDKSSGRHEPDYTTGVRQSTVGRTRGLTKTYPTARTSTLGIEEPNVIHSVYKQTVSPRWLSVYLRHRVSHSPPTRSHDPSPRPATSGTRILNFEQKISEIQSDMGYMMPHIRAHADTYYSNISTKARSLRGHRRPFRYVQSFLGNLPSGYKMGKSAFEQLEFLKNIRKRYTLSKEEVGKVCRKLGRLTDLVKPNKRKVRPDMDLTELMSDEEVCPFPDSSENECDRKSKYRTIDGSCNNMRHPMWGRSMKPLLREVPHDYEDGISEPRSRGVGKRPLKSAREVSLGLMPDVPKPSHTLTMLHMTFGQLVDHDIARTAMTMIMEKDSEKLVDVECGDSGCETEGPENAACLPIKLAKDDPDFTGHKKCLMFVRSQEVVKEDCSLGPREQLNQVTSYLDASFVYGNFLKDAKALRNMTDPKRGRLILTPNVNPKYKGLLPQKNHRACRDFTPTQKCFIAGDTRANEQIALVSIHTIFHRYHNTIEERLHKMNRHWDGERLYQEARMILGAIWQQIVYNEYLPPTLGPSQMRRFGLKLLRNGYYNVYDESENVDTGNAFQTAAFRFGHSQITNSFPLGEQKFKVTSELKFSQVFDRPTVIYDNTNPGGSGLDCIMLGQLSQDSEGSDNFFAKEVTANLFSENPTVEPGTDLPALNMHRGRDHGLPGYVRFREWCGLNLASDFDQLHDIPENLRKKLAGLYDHVYDIDLFAGGMMETPLQGALVGPTFACIIARQFRKFRVGDRFWFERQDRITGFTRRQLANIRKMTLSRVMCDTMDYVDTIQKFALLHPFSVALKKYSDAGDHDPYTLTALYNGEKNERRPCSELPDLDISLWKEAEPTRASYTNYRGDTSGTNLPPTWWSSTPRRHRYRWW